MAVRASMTAGTAVRGLSRFFCTNSSPFNFSPPFTGTPVRVEAEPSNNLFVSGLSKRTTSEKLQEAFAQFGEVVHARVVTDRVSGYSKGFGFVRYATIEDAAKGIEGMDGKFLDGWVIFAEFAKPRAPPSWQSENASAVPPYGSR